MTKGKLIILLLSFLNIFEECKSAKEEEVSFEFNGIYVADRNFTVNHLGGNDIPFKYQSICIEIRKPDLAIVRLIGADRNQDISMKWVKGEEEGKYKIKYEDRVAYLYEDRRSKRKSLNSAYITYMLTLKETKPLSKETNNYSSLTKSFRIPSLEECTISARQELNTPPDPSPDNN